LGNHQIQGQPAIAGRGNVKPVSLPLLPKLFGLQISAMI